MPIPDSYRIDVVRALVQDPFHLLVYWELRDDSLEAIHDLFPNNGAGFRPTMRLVDYSDGFEAYVNIPTAGKYWFGTLPGHRYRVDVGARSVQYGFVPIVRSNFVETPRGTVSPELDADPDYRVDTPRFVRLLSATGFATDEVIAEVARTEQERETGMPAAEVAPSHTPPPYIADAFAKLPDAVRRTAARISLGGTITIEEILAMPEGIRELLLTLARAGEFEVVTAAFIHLLPQLMRQVLEGRLVADATHPFHLPPRFALGASEQIRRPRVDWTWMPSMVERLSTIVPPLAPDPLDQVEN
jgi:hypothetical protein